MGKTLIRVDCIDQRLYISTAPTLASGGRNEDEIEFSFCALWDGFEKVAVFYRDKENVYHATVSENCCTIPHEVLADEGWMHFGVFGVKGDITRTSEIMRYRVTEGAITEGTAPSDPTPDIYAQMLDSLADLNNRVGALEKIGGVDGEIDLSDYALKSEIPDLIPTASATVKGGVKVGGGLSIDADGVLKTSAPVFIIDEPQDVKVYEDNEVTFTVKAIGVGLTYAWYYKNVDMSDFTKSEIAKSESWTFEATAPRDGRQVYCIITDTYGNALRTRTATLTLEDMEVGGAEVKYMPYYDFGKGLVVDKTGSMLNVELTAEDVGAQEAFGFSATDAGKLMYVGESGDMDLLQVGDGLQLEDGVMSVAPEGTYELIETIRLDGLSALTVDKEPDGTPYRFDGIIMDFYSSNLSGESGHMYPKVFDGSNVEIASWGIANIIVANETRYFTMDTRIEKRAVFAGATDTVVSVGSAPAYKRRPVTSLTDEKIAKISLTTTVPFPEGSTLAIKGVRANA